MMKIYRKNRKCAALRRSALRNKPSAGAPFHGLQGRIQWDHAADKALRRSAFQGVPGDASAGSRLRTSPPQERLSRGSRGRFSGITLADKPSAGAPLQGVRGKLSGGKVPPGDHVIPPLPAAAGRGRGWGLHQALAAGKKKRISSSYNHHSSPSGRSPSATQPAPSHPDINLSHKTPIICNISPNH